MMEAYQVKMEQLADDVKATCPACTTARGILVQMVEGVRKILAQRCSPPSYSERLLSGTR